MLFHVVFSRESFIASRAKDVFLSGMFFPMARGVAGGGEGVGAGVALGVRARVFFLCERGFIVACGWGGGGLGVVWVGGG